jgi:hypothetical protein
VWDGSAWVPAVLGAQGAQGPTGATGSSGVIAVTSPITNSGSSTSATIGINQALISVAQSQVTGLTTDLAAKVSTANLQKAINASSTAVETFPRYFITTNTIVSGTVYLAYFTPTIDLTVSQITMGAGLASATLTLARMGLYTVDSSDVATLVAQTASDTTLFLSNQTNYTRSFSTAGGFPATYSLVAGSRYAVGVIVVGTTMGSLLGVGGSNNGSAYLVAPRVTSSRAGQTDLTTTNASHGAVSQLYWARLS